MCGIIAAISLDGHTVNDEVCNQFQDQSTRGTRGFGAAMLEEPEDKTQKPFITVRRSTDEIGALLDLKLFPSTMILFHHRQPTSSDNKIQQTHPILVSNEMLEYDWLIAHNGMIHNSDEIKEKHFKEYGIVYSTDNGATTKNYNDSEAVATELAMFFERAQLKKNYGIDMDNVSAKGSAAIIGMQLDKATKQPLTLFYGRNSGNMLHAFRDQRVIFISSEGKGEMVGVDEYTFVDLLHSRLKQKTYTIKVPYAYTFESTSKGGASLPIRHGVNVQDDDDRHWEQGAALNEGAVDDPTVTALEETFGFTGDPNMTQEAEEAYDELESLAQQFVETICNPDSVDYADSYIHDMQEAMETLIKKMKDHWAEQILTEEQKGTDKIIAEAARDKEITVTPTPAIPVPKVETPVHSQFQANAMKPEEKEEALQNGA